MFETRSRPAQGQGAGVAKAADGAGAIASGNGCVADALALTAQVAGLAGSGAADKLQSAAQVAGMASALVGGTGRAPSAVAEAVSERVSGAAASGVRNRIPDEHPLGGQAFADFMAPLEMYAPPLLNLMTTGPAAAAGDGLLDDSTRLMRLYAPLSGEKRLYVASMEGSAALSDVYSYRLQLLSYHAAIDLQEVMGKSFTVALKLADGSEHPINGYVTSFGFSHTDGGLAVYTAELTPWLWYLGKRINSRIYQDLGVLDVLDKVFADYGSLPDYTVRVSKRPPPETYIVQYDESDLNFVSRLLERYGLFYYFEHRGDGHTLVISDNSLDSGFCPPQAAHAVVRYNAGQRVIQEDTLTSLSAYRQVQPGMVALNTFKYADPYGVQYVEQPTLAQQGDVPKLKVYHGNPAYTHKNREAGRRDAQQLMESYEWQAKLFHAQSECRGMVVGHTFQLKEHHWFDAGGADDADFLVVGAQIDARNNFDQNGGGDVYRNSLTLIRRKIPYRPVRFHPKPVMKGPQTATVVGPKGEEIHTDRYGRIKVQFPWDLEGRHNEASSCWIRVSQPWAGRGWGTVAIPRIGQEVLIDYIEGDPDRPVCTGRLFNAAQTVPFNMPDGANVMGFISNSTPGGNGQCRMTICDKAGDELVDLFSQKDMTVETLNNHDTVVRGPQQTNTVTTGAQMNVVNKSITHVAETEHIALQAHTGIGMQAQTEGVDVIAKTAVQVQAETEHVLIKGKTVVRLEAGSASLELHEDGTILVNGVVVQIVGSTSIDLNP